MKTKELKKEEITKGSFLASLIISFLIISIAILFSDSGFKPNLLGLFSIYTFLIFIVGGGLR